MKILQIINSHALSDGGAQRLALEMHRSYLQKGHDSHLLSLMKSPVDEPNTYSFGLSTPYRKNVLALLCDFLKQERMKDVDLIHVHLFPAQLWVAMAADKLRLRIPMITTEHNTFNRRRGTWLGRLCDSFTLKHYQKIICISSATSDALAQWQPNSRKKLALIPNGIDLKRYSSVGRKEEANKTSIVIAVGRISLQKNYGVALQAVQLAQRLTQKKFELWVVGQDEMDGQMQQMAADLQISEQIHFLGYQADIPRLLQQADIYLLTSLWEGFGLAVVEAMAANLPIVCSDVPGVREVVQTETVPANSGGAAFLAPPQSPEAFAKHLAALLDSSSLRHAMGAQAKRKAQSYDITQTIRRHLDLYEDVLAVQTHAKN